MNLRQKQLRNPEAKLWDRAWRQLGDVHYDHTRIQLSQRLYIPLRNMFYGQLILQIDSQLLKQDRAKILAGLRDRLS